MCVLLRWASARPKLDQTGNVYCNQCWCTQHATGTKWWSLASDRQATPVKILIPDFTFVSLKIYLTLFWLGCDCCSCCLAFQVMLSLSDKERQAVMRFVTSCSRAPLGGFQHLNPPLTLHKVPPACVWTYVSDFVAFSGPVRTIDCKLQDRCDEDDSLHSAYFSSTVQS